MEEKILYNVLKSISLGQGAVGAPDSSYVTALATIGLIKTGWDDSLTDFGQSMMNYLENKLHSWR